jgi:hypothetical protein
MRKPQPPAKGKRAAAAAKSTSSKVKVVSFASQSNLDFPFRTYADIGRKEMIRLTEHQNKKGKRKLSPYELFLMQTHFPSLEKKYIAEQTKAAATRRKAARRAAIARDGLVEAEDFSRKPIEVRQQKRSTRF